MKRRDVLAGCAGLLGSSGLLSRSIAAGRPCPPSPVSVAGGTTVSTTCSAADAAADWLARSTAPGVLWNQRFTDQAAHVDRYLYATTPAAGVTYTADTTDGILSDGCLKISVAQGAGDTGRWMRPFQPQPGDINRPGVPVGPGFPTTARGVMSTWQGARNGYIAHPSQQIVNPSAATDGPFVYIGTEMYIQFRIKFSPGRFSTSTQMPTSKLLVLETNYQQVNHRLVLDARHRNQDGSYYGGPFWSSYTAASGHGSFDDFTWGGPGINFGTGGNWSSTCQYPNLGPGRCAPVRENEWMVVYLHLKPGTHLGANTVYEMKIAYQEDLAAGTYRTVLASSVLDWLYDLNTSYNASNSGRHPGGLNTFEITTYTGGGAITPAPAAYWTKYDQVIFSLMPIACPVA